ncbi:MAG: DUF488 domain-containing protein [Xanthobacteraceae bacterium]|jgi:uncharacterized protein (DUF488 family)
MAKEFFTIGHATRPVAEFIELLTDVEVRLVVDVRTMPRSSTNPQFDREALASSLAVFDIDYRHIAALGGLRRKQREISASVNAYWQNQSFHNYADYAMSREFRSALDELRQLGHASRCAIMCAETLWWRCHRRVIADYLLAAGESVFHILRAGHIDPAHMTAAAKRRPDGVLIYPANS